MFPDRLRLLRQEMGYTQRRMGEQFGVSQQTVAQWEKGTREPDHKMLKKIARFFNVSLDYLMGVDKAIDTQIAENIKRSRERLGVSQSTLAEYLGVNVQKIDAFEQGKELPSVSELEKISSGLWTTPENLMSMQHLFDESFIREKFLLTVMQKYGYTCLKEISPQPGYTICVDEKFYRFTEAQFDTFNETIDECVGFLLTQLLKKATEVLCVDHEQRHDDEDSPNYEGD